MNDRRILITGGAGFIGSTIADLFLAKGWDVAILDDLSSGKRENLPAAARFYECDVRSGTAREVIAEERPAVICHHAAQIDVRRSMADPRFDCDVNLGGLLNLLQAAVDAKSVRQFLFASSGGTIYGDTDQIPTREDHPTRPVSVYGASKAAGELYLGVYRASYGIDFAALRYGNVYGPRQDPHGEAGVIAIFSGRMVAGEPCTIYGDGTQSRDYVFVGDVARANLLAAEKRFSGSLNIGTGIDTDVNRLHALMARVAGIDTPPRYGTARVGEQRRVCIDPAAARSALGWTAEVPLEQGLRRTLDYFRKS